MADHARGHSCRRRHRVGGGAVGAGLETRCLGPTVRRSCARAPPVASGRATEPVRVGAAGEVSPLRNGPRGRRGRRAAAAAAGALKSAAGAAACSSARRARSHRPA